MTPIVYTSGVFDLFHHGHLNLLQNARALGEKLVVGVQDDASVKKQKGYMPIFTINERTSILRALKPVDCVLVYSDLDQRAILEMIKPSVVVQGEDWFESGNRREIVEYLEHHHIQLVRFPYTKGVSSTEIRKIIQSKTHLE